MDNNLDFIKRLFIVNYHASHLTPHTSPLFKILINNTLSFHAKFLIPTFAARN
jgi:hypothetical protein